MGSCSGCIVTITIIVISPKHCFPPIRQVFWPRMDTLPCWAFENLSLVCAVTKEQDVPWPFLCVPVSLKMWIPSKVACAESKGYAELAQVTFARSGFGANFRTLE